MIMGKSSTLKKIRRAASSLPVVMTRRRVGEVVSGYDLEKEGVTKVKGKAVNVEENYKKISTVNQPINHNRKMKQILKIGGISGVNQYINYVKQNYSPK